MLHLRYDWRRKIVWALICVVLFLSSQTVWNKEKAGEMAKREFVKRNQGWAGR